MDVAWFYLLAVVPVAYGGVLWATRREIAWQEWLGSSALCFLLAGLFHLLAFAGRTSDVETWSGHIVSATHFPEWVEEYEEMHTRTVGSGKDERTEIYYTTEHRTHHERWAADSDINTEHGINRASYEAMVATFGNRETEQPYKSGFHSGDRNVYVTRERSGRVSYPVTDRRSWSNKVRATPTVFSFPIVPPGTKVFPYPANADPFRSDRLVGTAASLDLQEFDRMNARLGPRKKVNVIFVGFGDQGAMAAEWQRAAWVGGKKNDVVLCWGGPNAHPAWALAFGWTDAKTCLRSLESIAMESGVSDATLPIFEREITANYRLKDWDVAFAHIRVPAAPWASWAYLITLLASQAAFWAWAMKNRICKGNA